MGKLIKPVQANQTLGSSLPHKNVQVEPSILSKDTQITGINKMEFDGKEGFSFFKYTGRRRFERDFRSSIYRRNKRVG